MGNTEKTRVILPESDVTCQHKAALLWLILCFISKKFLILLHAMAHHLQLSFYGLKIW